MGFSVPSRDLYGDVAQRHRDSLPISPLAGEMSPEATEGGGATNPTVEFAEPPPSVSSADIFPARGKKGSLPPC